MKNNLGIRSNDDNVIQDIIDEGDNLDVESASVTTDCRESDSQDGSRSTAPTSAGDGMLRCTGEEVDPRETKNEKGGNLPLENLLSDLSLDRPVSSGLAAFSQHDACVAADNNVIDLDTVDAEPSTHITDALGDFELAGPCIDPSPSLEAQPSAPPFRCKTEPNSTSSIFVGVKHGGKIHRWVPGSTITFNANCESFPDLPYATYAARCLERAANEWHKDDLGVQFRRVPDDKPAVFQLMYSSQAYSDDEVASAFFPSDPPAKRQLYVYGKAFSKDNHEWMTNAFCHELGHIIGLRHEFAQLHERDLPSKQLGKTNRLSIMNYFGHLSQFRIQDTDYDGVRRLYKLNKGEYHGYKLVDVKPTHYARISPPSLPQPSFHPNPRRTW
ncbi:hypothetical protein F4677DRAFT_302085 [Hypoxylon crocopeplum]|nr:hypothetical protein F4677DRAFT_302085 [Hypoxylon crocopeplum]